MGSGEHPGAEELGRGAQQTLLLHQSWGRGYQLLAFLHRQALAGDNFS